jgi:glycosyltransferase involved in cell wall biosynthesis
MMEAQSFGIPVLGPDVGGISEIVSSDCGALFPADATPEKIAHEIERTLILPEKDYQQLRQHAYDNWRNRYNADQNFSTFARQISAG